MTGATSVPRTDAQTVITPAVGPGTGTNPELPRQAPESPQDGPEGGGGYEETPPGGSTAYSGTQRTRYGGKDRPIWQRWWAWVLGFLAICVIMGNVVRAAEAIGGSETPPASCETVPEVTGDSDAGADLP